MIERLYNMDEFVKEKVMAMKPLSINEMKQMNFFELALYLQELNQIKELCEFELDDDNYE